MITDSEFVSSSISEQNKSIIHQERSEWREKGGGKEKRKRGKECSGIKEEGQMEGKDLKGDQNTISTTMSHTHSVDTLKTKA